MNLVMLVHNNQSVEVTVDWSVLGKSLASERYILPGRYDGPATPINKGAFGRVFSVYDKSAGSKVAVKVQHLPSGNQILYKRALRELNLLRKLGGQNNVVKLLDAFTSSPTNTAPESKLFLITQLMEMDLDHAIKTRKLQSHHVRPLFRKILVAMQVKGFPPQNAIRKRYEPKTQAPFIDNRDKNINRISFIHNAKVIHRDLKTSNIGVSGLSSPDPLVCILDFGLARTGFLEMTPWVVTLGYRAPELLCGLLDHGFATPLEYHSSVDVWSLGCIFAEMIKGIPLPTASADNAALQLAKVVDNVGFPPAEVVQEMGPQSQQVILALETTQNPQASRWEPLKNITEDEPAFRLLKRLLNWNAKVRISATTALQDDYFAECQSYDIELETMWNDANGEQLKGMLVRDVAEFRAETNPDTRR